MPRKPKARAPHLRRITINVTVEGDLAERKIRELLPEFPGILDDLRDDDDLRQIRAIWAVVHDGQDPIVEYQYLQGHDGPEHDVLEVRVADDPCLDALGYTPRKRRTKATKATAE